MLAFGTTAAGMVNHFKDATAATRSYCFHEIDDNRYREVFDAYRIRDEHLTEQLGVSGSETILRGNLGAMLQDLLGREPQKHELHAWFTFCDFDRNCTMGMDEYRRSVEALLQFSASPAKARTYSSWSLKQTHRAQARLPEQSPQMMLSKPLTAAQEVGWHAAKPGAAMRDEMHCLNHTDVTKKEGRTAVHYFGHYVQN